MLMNQIKLNILNTISHKHFYFFKKKIKIQDVKDVFYKLINYLENQNVILVIGYIYYLRIFKQIKVSISNYKIIIIACIHLADIFYNDIHLSIKDIYYIFKKKYSIRKLNKYQYKLVKLMKYKLFFDLSLYKKLYKEIYN
jgi:hypothetical protein